MLNSDRNLYPGQVVFCGQDTLVFLKKLPDIGGYLFNTGKIIFNINSLEVILAEQVFDTFVVSEMVIDYLRNATRIDLCEVYMGMTVLEVDSHNRVVRVRRIVVVDHCHGFAFDENGEMLNTSKLLVDTGVRHSMVPGDKCKKELHDLYADC